MHYGYKHISFSSIIFKLTRNNNAPRLLNILHPIGYIHLCKEIIDDWDLIRGIIDDVPDYENISLIVPKSDNKSGRLTSMDSYDSEIDRLISLKACNKNEEERKIAIDKQLGKKYYVFADIASCFPTIYSHAIPWACVGHTEAKRTDKDDTLWYNKLDRKNRKTQRNETIGIAIGPDTSNIITELILSQIDKELSNYSYTRYIDDYKCYCSTKEEADQFLRDLAGLLEKYHLRLNSKKTKILQLLQPLEEIWVRRIREFYNSELQYENEIFFIVMSYKKKIPFNRIGIFLFPQLFKIFLIFHQFIF